MKNVATPGRCECVWMASKAVCRLTRMAHTFSMPFPDPAFRPLEHALDSFVEVQVHGELSLENDVERLVADPAFRDHPTGEILAGISRRFGIPLSWHPGYRMPVREVPDIFRDYPVRPLAERIAGDGMPPTSAQRQFREARSRSLGWLGLC